MLRVGSKFKTPRRCSLLSFVEFIPIHTVKLVNHTRLRKADGMNLVKKWLTFQYWFGGNVFTHTKKKIKYLISFSPVFCKGKVFLT